MRPATYMGAVLQLVKVEVCSIGIGHQRALEVTEEFLDDLPIAAAIKVIADLGGQVDDHPHISFLVMHLAIGIGHLSVNPGLIAINCRAGLQQPRLYNFLKLADQKL